MRRSKYGAIKTKVDGIVFDSKKEAARYCELKTLSKCGVIQQLELQPTFDLEINGVRVCKYKADFKYIENGEVVTEDVKGMLTPIYRLKKKMMKAIHGIEIRET